MLERDELGEVELYKEPKFGKGWHNPALKRPEQITRCRPYWQGPKNGYVHRVRSASLYYGILEQTRTYTVVNLWCGSSGYVRSDSRGRARKTGGYLIDHVENHGPLCATCEGRAVGAGFDSDFTSIAHPLIFSPTGIR